MKRVVSYSLKSGLKCSNKDLTKANKQEKVGLIFFNIAKGSCSERADKAVKASHVYHFYSTFRGGFGTLIPLEEAIFMLVIVASTGQGNQLEQSDAVLYLMSYH